VVAVEEGLPRVSKGLVNSGGRLTEGDPVVGGVLVASVKSSSLQGVLGLVLGGKVVH